MSPCHVRVEANSPTHRWTCEYEKLDGQRCGWDLRGCLAAQDHFVPIKGIRAARRAVRASRSAAICRGARRADNRMRRLLIKLSLVRGPRSGRFAPRDNRAATAGRSETLRARERSSLAGPRYGRLALKRIRSKQDDPNLARVDAQWLAKSPEILQSNHVTCLSDVSTRPAVPHPGAAQTT